MILQFLQLPVITTSKTHLADLKPLQNTLDFENVYMRYVFLSSTPLWVQFIVVNMSSLHGHTYFERPNTSVHEFGSYIFLFLYYLICIC